MTVAELLGKSPAELAEDALRLLSEGDVKTARMAAAMAARAGDDCPFADRQLQDGWMAGLKAREMIGRTVRGPLGSGLSGRGHIGMARAMKDDDLEGLDL